MGRRVETGAQAGGPESGIAEGRRAALPLGAGDVNGRAIEVRVAQPFQEPVHALKGVNRFLAGPVDPVAFQVDQGQQMGY